jgi:hypothetical protein
VAGAEIVVNSMAAARHVMLDGAPALLHYSRRQDVVAWPPACVVRRDQRRVRNVTE